LSAPETSLPIGNRLPRCRCSQETETASSPPPILALFEPESPPAKADADDATTDNNYLHRLASSANPRNSRLLAYADPVSESDVDTNNNPRLARARERITNRLSDRTLFDSNSRFAAADGMVSIKF
jgi:hypothetical protein